MIVMGARRPMVEEVCEKAIEYVPKVWAHARAMQRFNQMGWMDKESFRLMVQTFGATWKNIKWVSSIPLPVAAVLNQQNPDIFHDTSGRTMLRFLARNPQYVPAKGKPRVSVSFP